MKNRFAERSIYSDGELTARCCQTNTSNAMRSSAICYAERFAQKHAYVLQISLAESNIGEMLFVYEISLTLLKCSVKTTQRGQYKNYKEHFYRFKLDINTMKADGNINAKVVAKETLAVNKSHQSNKKEWS